LPAAQPEADVLAHRQPGKEGVLLEDDAPIRPRPLYRSTVDAAPGGRTALLLGGVEPGEVRRGQVLTTDPTVIPTSRVLVAVRAAAGVAPGAWPEPPADRERLELFVFDTVLAQLVR
jgi:hypothetical protein